jgi:hypothetical protein
MENYNTKYVCTYSQEDENDDPYRQDLLNIFGIQEFNEEIINNSLTILFHTLKQNERMLKCMKQLASRIISEDAEIGMVFLYSFGYMENTHICVCEFLETGNISGKTIELLENII